MSLTAPRVLYGIHSVAPYRRDNGLFYGILKVLKSSSLSLAAELVELMGGSSKYAWAVEDGPINAEMSLKFSQYEDFLFELFLGKAPTSNAAETSGNVSTLTNKYGTSAMSATIGVASVTVLSASKANLKFGKYVIKVISATTIHVYLSSDADIGRGTNSAYQSDDLKITATVLTIVSATATDVAELGLSFTGGSGTIGMTVGDTATFEVRPVNSGSMTVRIGSVADQVFPEFGCVIVAQKRGNQELTEIDAFRCKGAGMPINFDQNAYSEAEVKVKIMYDTEKDGVFDVRHVKPSAS